VEKLKKLFGKKERHICKRGIVKFGAGSDCNIKLPANLFDEEEINFKILYSFYRGFYVKCCGKLTRTCVKVTKLPYYIDLNMVIQVGKGILLAVEKINPLPKRPEDPAEGILFSTK